MEASPSSPFLFLEKLMIIGRDKNYSLNFNKGLNIIYGDFDTGKSSVLNLIDYLLGASELDTYDEIEMNGRYALLQLRLNGEIFTIKRDLFNKNEFIEVFSSEIENIENVFPKEYGPNYSKAGSNGYISDFFLQALNIPLIKVREAPTKDDSPTKRLSFRDIFKYCYLDQDDVGSKQLLENGNHSKYVKVKETFKFLHMVLDSQIAELENEVKEKTTLKKSLEDRFNNISLFFRETKLGTEESLDEELNKIHANLIQIEDEIKQLTSSITSDTSKFNEIREMIRAYEIQISQKGKEKLSREISLEQKQRLKKEYLKDITKLKTSLVVSKHLPKHEHSDVSCPICDNLMSLEDLKNKLGENPVSAIESEIKHLNGHIKSVTLLIEDDISNISNLEQKLVVLSENLNKYKDFLDIETHKYISPYVSQRDNLISQKASLIEQKNRLDYLKKLRIQLNKLTIDSNLLGNQIAELKRNIVGLKEQAPSIDALLQKIADYLSEFLNFIPIKNPTNININHTTFLPIVRNRDYIKLTSGGLRTLVSIGFFLSLLRNSILSNTYFPRFLMIDTVGKYIGKTDNLVTKNADEIDEADEVKEGLRDPIKFNNLYKYFIEFNNLYGDSMQIILVDNDLPENLEHSLQQYVVKHFRRDGRDGCSIGLIDDAR